MFELIVNLFENTFFLLIIKFIATVLIFILFFCLIIKFFRNRNKYGYKNKFESSFCFFILFILGILSGNLNWIFFLLLDLKILNLNKVYLDLILAFLFIPITIGYHALGLFLESLIAKKFLFRFCHKVFLVVTFLFILVFFFEAIYCFKGNLLPSWNEYFVIIHSVYVFIIYIPSVFLSFKKIKNKFLPKILEKQLKTFLYYFIVPYLFFDFLDIIARFYNNYKLIFVIANLYTFIAIYGISYCAVNLIRYRFLNILSSVQLKNNPLLNEKFITDVFQISNASDFFALDLTIRNIFFRDFFVDLNSIEICFNLQNIKFELNYKNEIEAFFIKELEASENIKLLKEFKIIIRDEIEFDIFMDTTKELTFLINFLNKIDSEVFLPIFSDDKFTNKSILVGFINIKRSAMHRFYSKNEYYKMLLYVKSISAVISVLNSKEINDKFKDIKSLKDAVIKKNNEIEQYKESLRNFIKKDIDDFGVFYFFNNKFHPINKEAESILDEFNSPDFNNKIVFKKLNEAMQKVNKFKTIIKDKLSLKDKNYFFVAIPDEKKSNSNLIPYLLIKEDGFISSVKEELIQLKDPNKFDYCLYLRNTKIGKLINDFMPSNSAAMLNLKVDILEASLSNKAVFLNSELDDMRVLVDIIFKSSMREKIHFLNVERENANLELELFGLNKLFEYSKKALLEELGDSTVLVIKNPEFLDFKTQNKLADFIKYGGFCKEKSDKMIFFDIKIIFYSTNILDNLVKMGKINNNLAEAIKNIQIIIPSLFLMKDLEFEKLCFSYLLKESNFNEIDFFDKEKDSLFKRRPLSFVELKNRINILLSKKTPMLKLNESVFSFEFNALTDELKKAQEEGRSVLSDKKTMELLWREFSHSQSKIAKFLNVDRSSVSRRCKEYGFIKIESLKNKSLIN